VLTLIRGEGAQSGQRELVLAQVAYVNALRMHLRRAWNWDELTPWLSEPEIDALRAQPNVPQAILLAQARRLAAARARDETSEFRWMALDATLRRLTDHQGGCERIKNTVFPQAITLYTTWLVRGLILVVPLVLVGGDDRWDWVQALEAFAIATSFVLMERLGHELKTPFEGAPNDTPMSSICRTVERDLLSMLGERELPAPIEPERGVLL
jgi:putative membrane protein